MSIDDLIKSAEAYEKEQLDASVISGSKQNPDHAAKVYNLSREKGLPIGYVERNLDRVTSVDTSTLTPSVAQLLRDREKSKIAHDDVDNLSWWESAAEKSKNIASIAPAAVKSISSAGYSALGSTFNAITELSGSIDRAIGVSEEDIKRGDFMGPAGKYMLDISRAERQAAEAYMSKDTGLHPAVAGGIKSAIMNVPALAAGIISRSPSVALGAMGGVTYGESYLTAKDAGLDETTSMSYAVNQTIAEVATERLPAIRLLKDIGADAGLLKTVASQVAAEIPSEQVATIWQDAIDWATLNPDKTLREFMEERPDAAVNTLISTVVAAGLQTSAVVGIDRLTREKEKEQISELITKASESKVRGRSPEVFGDYVDDLVDTYGTADAVYIDAKEARPLFQEMVKDDAYDLIAGQIDEAEAVGGDIVIPMRDFLTVFPASKNIEAIKGSIRLTPESRSSQESQPERIADLIKTANKNIETKNRADEIYKEVTKQLINTGRMNADVAKTSASIIPAYVTTKSIRSGLSVDDVYGMMGVSIQKADAINDIGLKQNTLREWDAILAGLDYADKKPQQGKDDATEFLSNAPAGTRYTDESKLLKRIRKSSDQVFNELGGSPEAGRVGKTSLGQFSAYRTQADIIEPDSIYPDGRIEVQVFGKEQDEQGLNAEPALTFTVSKDGELSVNGPTGETFDAFKDAGWAKESTGKSGETQSGWTSLVNKDGSQMPLSQLLPLIADVHARVRAWRGDDKVGLHWSRSTGATGGIVGGRQTAVFFQVKSGNLREVDLFGNGSRVQYFDDKKGLGFEKQVYPTGKEKWVVLELIDGITSRMSDKEFDTMEDAKKAVKSLKAVNTRKKNQQEKYGNIPDLWKGEERKIAKSIIDAGYSVDRFSGSSQSKSKYIYLDNGLKVRLADHDLPLSYDRPDVDYRYGGDINGLIKKIASKSKLLEQSNGETRGSFDPSTGIIKLTEASDLSTFLHEAGHLFLEMEGRLLSHPNATEQMKADGKVILDWLGLDSFDQLKDYETNDVSREAHEKFARGFEKYLGEGKAPSVELKTVFRRFAAWMRQVYRDLRKLNVELTDDVRAVMDRMLASDDEINRLKHGFKPLFESAKDAGMTEAEYKAYTTESSIESGNEVLLAKMIKQLNRQYTKWWKDESAVVAARIKKDLLQSPLYSASEFLKGNHTIKGLDQVKLRSEDVRNQLGEITPKFRNMTEDGGTSADDLAAIFGFSSGFEMIDLIQSQPTFNQAVKTMTEQEMIARHGDILNDGTIREEAEQAIRNPEQAKRLIAELNALSRKTGDAVIDRESIKAYAKEIIGKMPVSKIRPAQYRSAEIRAAREAAVAKSKGDMKAALRAKTQELINFYLSREAATTKAKAESNRKYLQSILVKKYDPKAVNPDYITQMRALSRLYDFRKSNDGSNERAMSELQSTAAWIEAQEQNEDNGYYPVVIDSILSRVQAAAKAGTLKGMVIPSYKTMTADELDGIAEQARNLRYIGGQLSENAKESQKKEADAVAASIRANASGVVNVPEEVSRRDKVLSGLREFGQDHIRLANQIEEMDGYKQFGPLFESFYQGIIDASNKELKLKRGTFDDLKGALSGLKAKEMAEGKDEVTITLQSGEKLTLSRRARIVFGLYWGSPEGREAIRQGHGMTDIDAQNMLNTLEDKDIDAIIGIWAANEKHWPEVSRINQKLKGVTLPKVEHVPYSVNGKELPGGYFRLFYQYDQRDSIREIKDEDMKMTRTGNRLARQTKSGARNERVGSGGRKVSWEFNNVFVALDETIHDIAFAEVASKSSRFIRSSNVAAAIIDSYGKEKYDSMVGALSGVIAGNTSMSHPINGFLRHFRVAQTYAFLGYSIRNFVQQPLAYANVLGKSVGSFEGFSEKKVLAEAVKFVMSPKETIAYVDGKSEFMINRTSIVNRDTAELKQRLSSGTIAGGAWQTFMDHAFDIQTVGDSLVAYPAWMSAYNEGIKKFADEKKAVTFADEFVSSTIGSGLIKDMSPMLQGGGRVGQAIGSEQLKVITFMGSFFNVNLNLMRDSFKKASYLEIKGVKTIPTSGQFYRQMMWYSIIPALLGAWITGDSPDEDDDQSFLAWASGTIAGYNLATIFFLRDLVSLARGFGPSSSYTRALDASARIAKDAVKIAEGEKDFDAATMAKLVRSAGMVMPIPFSGQAARTMEYLGSDEEFNPYKALVTGVER